MKSKTFAALAMLMLSGHIAGAQVVAKSAPNPRAAKLAPGRAGFVVTALVPLENPDAKYGPNRLDLPAASAWNTEDIIVYAKRHSKAEPGTMRNDGLTIGTVVLSGANKTDQLGFTGMTVTATAPIAAIPGLSAVATLSGGHEAVNASTTRQSAALTAGFKWQF